MGLHGSCCVGLGPGSVTVPSFVPQPRDATEILWLPRHVPFDFPALLSSVFPSLWITIADTWTGTRGRGLVTGFCTMIPCGCPGKTTSLRWGSLALMSLGSLCWDLPHSHRLTRTPDSLGAPGKSLSGVGASQLGLPLALRMSDVCLGPGHRLCTPSPAGEGKGSSMTCPRGMG